MSLLSNESTLAIVIPEDSYVGGYYSLFITHLFNRVAEA